MGIESLSIGATMTIGEYAIVDKLAAFLNRHPDVNIHLHYGNTAQLLKLLDEGQISLAIVEGNYPKEHYGHMNYSTEDYIAVCSADHHFIHGRLLLPSVIFCQSVCWFGKMAPVPEISWKRICWHAV